MGILRAVLFWFLLAVTAYPATYYVSTTGNDSNSGSTSSPFLTVTKGTSVLTSGDVLYIRPGTYPQSLFDAIPTGTASLPVTVTKDPLTAGVVTLRPATGAIRALNFGTARSYITVSNLVLDCALVSSDCVKISNGANHITLDGLEIKNAPNGQGVLITPPASDSNTIRNSIVHDNGNNDQQHQFYVRTNNNLIEKCQIYGGFGYAIHQYDGPPTGNIYRRNLIHNTFGILVSSGSGSQVYYNVLYSNLGDISVQYSEAGALIYNNTCYQGTRGLYTDASTSGTIFRNNISYLHTDFNGNYISQGAGTTESNNLLGVNPLFVNAAAANLHLLAGSPAINAGLNVGLTPDYDGNPVPFGAAPDIGAYEFGLPPPAPTNLRRGN